MITPLPTPPSRRDPSNFVTRADAFLGALPTFAIEANALAADVKNKQVTATNAANTATTQAGIATTQAGIATNQAGIATTKATEAATSASTATNAANTATTQADIATTQAGIATTKAAEAANSASTAINAPGTSATSTTSLTIGIGTKNLTIQTGKAYVAGQPVIIARTADPSGTWMTGNILSYNSDTGALSVQTVMKEGTGTFTDWTISLTAPVGISTIEERVEIISGNTAAEKFKTYVATANLTLILPASPSAGDWVKLQNSSTVTTITIARNGSNIMSLAEDLTIDALYVAVRLVYADATRGWVFG